MMKKHSKKNWNSEKILYLGGRGEGVSQIHEKKIVSVGLFSTFRNPLAKMHHKPIFWPPGQVLHKLDDN